MKFACSLLLLGCVSLAADVGLIEEIVAKVNGDIITLGDLERSRKALEGEIHQQGLAGAALQQALAQKQNDVLRDRIDQLLMVQRGKDLNLNVEPELTKYLAGLQTESKIAEPEKFQEYVKQQSGQSFEDFKSDVRNSMLTQRVMRQEVGGKMNIPREEQMKYYNEHKTEFVREERVYLREILVSTDGKDAAGIAASDKKAKDLVARARKGERFPEMARDNSDAVTAKNFGELGGFKKGELNHTVEDQVWDKAKGYVTDPVRVDNGFLILKVEEHQKAGQAEFADVENEVMEKLFAPRMQPAVREYLTKLRQQAFLEIKPGYVDSGAAPGKNTAWTDPAQLKPETVTKSEVVSKSRHKKLLWSIPIPGTKAKDTSSSK